MKRRPIVGINLKIYINTMDKATGLAELVKERFKDISDMDIFFIPSMGTVYPVSKVLQNTNIIYGVQNIASIANGAMTGEFSIESALDLGCTMVEIGHAERKRIFKEDYSMINEKVKLTLNHNMIPLVCIGESIPGDEREDALKDQILKILDKVPKHQLSNVVLAYEPEWAIGKDKPAETSYVHESHKMIRKILNEAYGADIEDEIRIIYGGSVKKENALDLSGHPDVDGLFIGRFGHDINNFEEIVNLVRKAKEEK